MVKEALLCRHSLHQGLLRLPSESVFTLPVDSCVHNHISSVLMCQWFAPTKLVVTFETQGMGRFTPEEIDLYLIKDNDGNPVALNLPTKFVLIANHQVCACYLYPCCLLS